ncbi:MAG: Uncharacterized protein G01um101418_93 [Parcubacteria group bacterium Gr01-1014_18]|nr:MAG: Uncharacterized protein Greene041636_397 [Parcubacteria group bacterium Greene0416_36]TSC81420.1 MAG: Uncharacterized protein G01um101418_93 [Parcubacteria group bacterium Gr01-1014_18]TSC99018.1 MAG: Uncharacterized protein Greene101420_374 [Parcubacteria group bacterium Greene1014_20]TSD07301.1 MAG: Uncharacterized protein Greene07142_317 [Parcubacteria group bacterium Greene0714_2]
MSVSFLGRVRGRIASWMHFLEALAARIIFYYPGEVKIIGVTGTDGKTTTTFLIDAVLRGAGYKTALCNGLVFRIGREEYPNPTDNTTPRAWIIHQFIKKAKRSGCQYIIIESTSWAIRQWRLWGIPFSTAVFTNLTLEHQDVHGSMDKYKESKGLLFATVSQAKNSTSIVNKDDPASDYFLSFPVEKKLSYSIKDSSADLWAHDIVLEPHRSLFKVCYLGQDYPIEINLPGDYNVANSLAAISLVLAEKIDFSILQSSILVFTGAPGRFEYVQTGKDYHVVVDFAHTPGAFRNLFSNVRRIYPKARIIAVFGAAGGRDPIKRPFLGEEAAMGADFSILTSDDPRFEDPETIARSIMGGFRKAGKHENQDFIFIKDRKEAIRKALSMASAGDVVLLLSMGAYEAMYVGAGKVPWNDKKAVEEIVGQQIPPQPSL